MIQVFKGKVELGNACRCGDDPNGALWVGGVDVVEEVEAFKGWGGPVTICVMDNRYEGPLSVELGWGYSDWTPMESDELRVGPHNIIEEARKYEGQNIVLVVANEPVNLLDLPPAKEPQITKEDNDVRSCFSVWWLWSWDIA